MNKSNSNCCNHHLDHTCADNPDTTSENIDTAIEDTSVDLSKIVDALCQNCSTATDRGFFKPRVKPLPSRDRIIELVEELRTVLFPGYFGTSNINVDNMRFHVGSALDHLLRDFTDQIQRGLCFQCPQTNRNDAVCKLCEDKAGRIMRNFTARIPKIQQMLAHDVQAAFDGDPAAKTPDETIFCYPGILAITNQRIAHELYLLKVPVIPRIITEHAHSITGIDIHPGATIGKGVFIDHGTGVVIGETCEFGANVKVYQGVTMGAKSFPKDEEGRPVKGIPRHPIVEDNVTIYSNATILGRIRIGHDSIIGGNVWLTHGVEPHSRVSQGGLREEHFDEGGGI